MLNRLMGLDEISFGGRRSRTAVIGIDVEAGIVGTGDLYADRVPGRYHDAGVAEIDPVLVALSRSYWFGVRCAVPIPGPDDAVTNAERAAIGMDLDEFRRPVGVRRRGPGVQYDVHRAADLEV